MSVAVPIYCQVEAAGRTFRVMLEMEGKFKGMVHVFDVAKSQCCNQDVVISGALWKDGYLWLHDDDIFENVEGLASAVERALYLKFAN